MRNQNVRKYSDQRIDYLALANCFSKCERKSSFQRACTGVAETLGYDYYLLGNYFPTVDQVILSGNFPKAWRKRYMTRGYSAIDPTMQHCWAKADIVDWHDIVYSPGVVGVSERNVMKEAKTYGLNSGISIPIHGVGTESGVLSFASTDCTSKRTTLDDYGLHAIAWSMSMSMKRLYNVPQSVAASKLSKREDECLTWTAKGKTSWEIAKILDISKDTVVFHMRNTIRKLESTNRPQAVAKAISLRILRPF